MTVDLGAIADAGNLRWLSPDEPRPYMAFHGKEMQGCVVRYKPTVNHDCEWVYAKIAAVERQKFLLVSDDDEPWLYVLNINALNNRDHHWGQPPVDKRIIGKWNNNSNAARYEGIEKPGIERYEKLFDKVTAARDDDKRKKHAKEYVEYRAKLYRDKQNGMKRKAAADGSGGSKKRVKGVTEVLMY